MTSLRGVRTMTAEDIPTVGRLFNRIFRNRDAASSDDFEAYFAEQCFGSPAYSGDAGSIVHADAEGHITGAIGVVPMQVRAGERVLTGRLMSIYMTDPEARRSGGADLVLTMRPRQQDFCFCDSANSISADHYKAIGGMVLPMQSLDWHRPLQPLRSAIARHARRAPPVLRALLGGLATPFDSILRKVRPSFCASASPLSVAAIDSETLADLVPSLLARFQVAPVWNKEEFGWLLDMASRNKLHGPLALCAVRNGHNETVGAFLYYGRSGMAATVLNVLAMPGCEVDVVAAMFEHLDRTGHIGAGGMAQPFLMEALCRQPHLAFQHRGFVCLSTRHADIRDAAARGDIYLGGLMGEGWSRLMADFN